MATGGGPRTDDLSHYQKLTERPEEYHIFQALRIIEAANADAPRLGESLRPRDDRVRLGQEAELAFPTSTIAAFHQQKGDRPPTLVNRFFGFFGPMGPLPLHLTEYARNRMRNFRDNTFIAFADMLTHRFLSLFYRAWAAGQPAVNYDRGEDPLARKVSALAGFHGRGLERRDAMPDDARRYFAAHLSMGQKTPDGLVAMLSEFLGVPVAMEEFVGSWLDLEPDDRWQLGMGGALGQTTSIGTRVWSRAAKFRIRIGPLNRTDYDRLLPGGEALERLKAVVRTYAGDSLDWDVNLILAGEDVPRAVLGGDTRLGHTSWVKLRRDHDIDPPDADDLYIYPRLTAA